MAPAAIGEPAEVANAREPPGQNMLQEAAQKLFDREGHGAALAVMRVVLPSKGDLSAVQRQQAVIGDGDAMGIASQILEYVFWAAKRRLGIDYPVLAEQRTQERRKRFLVGQGSAFPVEDELIAVKRPPEAGNELPAKHSAEHSHWQEEMGRCADGAAEFVPRYAEY